MNRLETTFVLSLLTVLIVFMGTVIGGQSGMVLGFLMAAAMNFFSYWFTDKIVLKMCGAQEIREKDHFVFYSMSHEPATVQNRCILTDTREQAARVEDMARGGW